MTAAEAIQGLFPQIRSNDIKLTLPGRMGLEINKEGQPKLTPMKTEELKKDGPKKGVVTPISQNQLRQWVRESGKTQQTAFFDPQDTKKEEAPKQPEVKKAPVHITAFGNRLIITSEDAEAVAQVQALVRLLMNTEAGPGDFEVIRLRNANAMEVSKVIDEMFNGKPQGGPGGRGGQGGGGFGGLGGGGGGGFNPLAMIGLGGGGGGNARVEKIRIVADATTNSLLVKAKPLDMLTIRRLGATPSMCATRKTNSKPRTISSRSSTPRSPTSRTPSRRFMPRAWEGDAQQQNFGGNPGIGFTGGPRSVDATVCCGRPCFASAWT